MRTLKTVMSVICLVLCVSCASQEEKQERKQNAFDLSGQYASTKHSETKLSLSISNETGRHDVLVKAKRNGLTEEEVDFFQNNNIAIQKVRNHFGNSFVIGKGEQNTLEGGENVSKDFGDSSELKVYSKEVPLSDNRYLEYWLQGTIHKDDFVLKGTLSAKVYRKKQNNQGDLEIEFLDEVSMNFEVSNDGFFYTQYFGRWKGKVEIYSEFKNDFQSLKQLKDLSLKETRNADFFYVKNVPAQLSFNGKRFAFKQIRYPIEQLSEPNVPALKVTYESRQGNEKLLMLGKILSLGQLTGLFVSVKVGQETPVGSFELKKK